MFLSPPCIMCLLFSNIWSILSLTSRVEYIILLKADRPHLRYYPYTPPDYRHTNKHLRLVMTLIGLCCTLFSCESYDWWTDWRYQVHYLPALRSIKVVELGNTHKRMDRHYQVHYLPDLLTFTVDKKTRNFYLQLEVGSFMKEIMIRWGQGVMVWEKMEFNSKKAK